MSTPSKQPDSFDLLVLGSGEAGKYTAWTMAGLGWKTAVIERRYIGGSCPNIACLPSKNIIQSSKVASYFFRSQEFGISKDNCKIHMSAVRDRKRRMVDSLVKTHLANFEASGAELMMGSGRFSGPRTLVVSLPDGGERVFHGKNIVISVGSRTSMDSTPGLREACPLTHVELLDLDHIPDHLVVLGGGYIGLELAQAMRRLGSNVTILERNSLLAHREDPDVSDALGELFRDEGIRVITNAVVKRVEGKSGQGIKVVMDRGGVEEGIEGSHLLIATGRTPNTENLGLELAGIETTDRGFIKVNDQLKTTAPGVWAVGDCAGSPHFTHIAFDDFRIVRDNLLGGNRVTTGRQVPFCVFTDPEFARLGLSETEAQKQGIPYRLAKIPMSAVLRAITLSETRGFLKVLIEPKSDHILGFSAFGVGAGEMLAPIQIAMRAGLPFTTLRDTIFTHPTLAEGLIPLFTHAPSGTAPASTGGRTRRK